MNKINCKFSRYGYDLRHFACGKVQHICEDNPIAYIIVVYRVSL